jgi:hypothetical protein
MCEGYIKNAVWWQAIEEAGISISETHFVNRVRRWTHERGHLNKRGESKAAEWALTWKGFNLKYGKKTESEDE